MAFTNEEFNIMVEELLYSEPISFTMLCYIAEKTLRKRIKYLCDTDDCLRGRGYEDDIMQEIQLRLMKTTVSHFLLKSGEDGVVNADPDGFKSWIKTVAENIKKDFSNKVRRIDFKTEDFENPLIEKELVTQDCEIDDEKNEKLKEAFSIVLSADVSVYKVLTWIAQFLFVISLDVTKIQSNALIEKEFEQKTLFEMYDLLLGMSLSINWIKITPEQNKKIMDALCKTWEDGVCYGDVPYKEFFMKVNGEKSGKKSISDWVNRMNTIVQKKYKKKSPEGKPNGKEGV